MRPTVACVALLALCSATARAQETQQDIAERIVQEQVELRNRRVERAVSAPAVAFDRIEDHPAASSKAAAPLPAQGLRSFPWAIVAFVAAGVVAGFALLASRRRADDR